MVDYQVPLWSERADRDARAIDLLGFDETGARPWIIELKVLGGEPADSALLQALRYSAVVDANRRDLSEELAGRGFGPTTWPAVVAIAGPHDWWEREDRSGEDVFRRTRKLAEQVSTRLGIRVIGLDLGLVESVWQPTGRAELLANPSPVARFDYSPPRG